MSVNDKITKRNGRVERFEMKKLIGAVARAGKETGQFDKKEARRLAKIVMDILEKANGKHVPTVEQVQDIVEQVLMAGGHYETAKAYILYRERRREERKARSMIGVVDDLGLSINQLKVIERRYLLHDEDGQVIETPKEWLTRVAKTLAGIEKKKKKTWEKKFFEVMAKMEFLPAGRTLNNAGTPQSQLANCFVLPVSDSMEGIFDAVKWTALVHQSGGGTGFNFTNLRPSGDVVTKSSGGVATGPVSFMKVFDVATRQVMQGGKKRGANMGILNVDHPDIMEFITCKTEEGEIANFNISVGITNEFMKAAIRDKNFWLKNPRTGEKVQKVSARMLLDQMVALAWRTGDPGMIFLDAINNNNPLREEFGEIVATNPCGEQPLHAFDACNLGSINLASFVDEGKSKDKVDERIDWERLGEVVKIAVRMLDNVIDACNYPLPQISETVRANRRIGLGVMGWADMLFALKVRYNSSEGVGLAEKVMKFIQEESWKASEELASEKGVFPRWEKSAFSKGWNPIKKKLVKGKKWKVRNVAITTIAPTGTISMVADTSSGIEPVFALSYVKNVVDDGGLTYVNKYFEEELRKEVGGNGVFNRLVSEISKSGSAAHVKDLASKLKKVFVTAHDVEWEWHIKMQAAFQEYIDNAVSKTINLPANAGMEEVKSCYIKAWETGCKGITVYRDSSKEYQVLSVSGGKKNKDRKKKIVIQSQLKAKTLKERMEEGLGLVKVETKDENEVCPDCGGEMTVQEGCSMCHNCGYSKCSI
jgi:ribonucleoside-diphosphate reductase alpha chain